MMLHEKTALLALFDGEGKWCQGYEALDPDGSPVRYDDDTAVSWDIVGGMCHLFGWRRACELFGQLHRHITGERASHYSRNDVMVAMAALLDLNDAVDTSYERVMETLRSMPIWHGHSMPTKGDAMCEI